MSIIRWVSCDLVTGRIIEELTDLRATSPVADILGAITTTTFALPIPLPKTATGRFNWIGATQPGRCMIVALDELGEPFWGGVIIRRNGGTGPLLQLSTVSLHGYLDRRYVGDHAWTAQDDTSVIAAGLLADAAPEGVGFIVDAPPSGRLDDRVYKATDNKTIYRAITELSGVTDGPEWTIDLAWQDVERLVITKTVRFRRRIGVPAEAPTAVFSTTTQAVFDTEGSAAAAYTFDEDYTGSKGANHVVAYSSGQGDSQPTSDPARDEQLLSQGWPRYEFRYQPSTNISDVSTLNSHAQAKVLVMRLGGQAWVIDARWSATPRLGQDWHIGDDIGWDLVGHRHPDGVTGIGRAIGWEVDPEKDNVQIVLWQPESEAAA